VNASVRSAPLGAHDSAAHDEPTRDELPFIEKRLALLFGCFVMVMTLFGLQSYKLTVIEGSVYTDRSENNFLSELPLIAPRGQILDRYGAPLAINEPSFEIRMSPFRLKPDEIRATGRRVAELLGRPDINQRAEKVLSLAYAWQSTSLVQNLSLDQVLPIQEQGFMLPGVIITPHTRRVYPAGELTGHITGHVGHISPEEKAQFRARGYLNQELVGKLAAELAFEDLLHGRAGSEIVERDAYGRPRSSYVDQPAQPGNALYLTLDLGLQRLAHALLGDYHGAIIVMDPRDGAVLAAVDRPGYDPNRPTRGQQYSKLILSPSAKGFPPGSTFKVVTAAAGLTAGFAPTDSVNCDGAYHLAGIRFPCHLRWGHDWENLYDALQHSCNVFFYRWAHLAGVRNMAAMAAGFGFGQPTGFELAPPGKEGGATLVNPNLTRVPTGKVLQMGIGQGELIGVTPIQMARAYAALCNGGKLFKPRILHEVRTAQGERVRVGQPEEQGALPLAEEHRRQILEGLRRVAQEPGGTGSRAGFKKAWRVAGKTGTAETGIRGKPSNAWFCGFAPFENPEVLVIVMVEQAGHGGDVAAPLARQLLAFYFGEPEPVIQPAIGEDKKPAQSGD